MIRSVVIKDVIYKYSSRYFTEQSRNCEKLQPPIAEKATNIYGEQDLFLAIAAKDCGMSLTTKHNKAAVCGWSANHCITLYACHP